MIRRYLIVRRAVRVSFALTSAALLLVALVAAANFGDARRCAWLRAHDPATAVTYDCEGSR